MSDGIIITGSSTGEAALIDDVKTAYESTSLPVLIGSGITTANLETYWPYADAFIVGSSFKKNGDWKNSVDEEMVEELMKKANGLHMINKSQL